MSEVKRYCRKPVTIEVCLTQSVPGQAPWVVEESIIGSLYEVDPTTFIVAYDSWIDDEKQTVTLKLSNGVLSMVRIGAVHSRQTFAANEWYASQYFLAGASVVCRNYTKNLDVAFTEEGGLIDLLYELWSGETHLGYFNLELFIHADSVEEAV
jgi:uncharacterized beta-barrel protein YwiB (DUF1934 family)